MSNNLVINTTTTNQVSTPAVHEVASATYTSGQTVNQTLVLKPGAQYAPNVGFSALTMQTSVPVQLTATKGTDGQYIDQVVNQQVTIDDTVDLFFVINNGLVNASIQLTYAVNNTNVPPNVGIVTSFNNRTGAVTLQAADVTGVGGALLASPAFTGTPTAPTPSQGDNSTRLATTAFVEAAVAGGASVSVQVYEFTATEGQTVFPVSFPVGSLVEVFENGGILQSDDYKTNNIGPVVLNVAAHADFQIKIVVSAVFSVANTVPMTGGTFTGPVYGVNPAANDDSTLLATTSWVQDLVGGTALSGLSDVNVADGPSINKFVLVYDATSSKWVAQQRQIEIPVWAQGLLTNSETIFERIPIVTFQLPVGLAGSVFECDIPATASMTITLNKNGSPIGTLVWAAAGTVPTVTFTTATTFNAGADKLSLIGPATADATAANFVMSFLGYAV